MVIGSGPLWLKAMRKEQIASEALDSKDIRKPLWQLVLSVEGFALLSMSCDTRALSAVTVA